MRARGGSHVRCAASACARRWGAAGGGVAGGPRGSLCFYSRRRRPEMGDPQPLARGARPSGAAAACRARRRWTGRSRWGLPTERTRRNAAAGRRSGPPPPRSCGRDARQLASGGARRVRGVRLRWERPRTTAPGPLSVEVLVQMSVALPVSRDTRKCKVPVAQDISTSPQQPPSALSSDAHSPHRPALCSATCSRPRLLRAWALRARHPHGAPRLGRERWLGSRRSAGAEPRPETRHPAAPG